VESFGQAARRAREAGFDFVSFHFCHGSLPHTNLSLLSNTGRTDKYADHFLFCEEILKRTQALCGAEFPIIPRLCCDENLVGGYDIEYFVNHYAPRLHALGIAVLDCTFGSMLGAPSRRKDIHSGEFIGPSFYTPKAVNLENIQTLKRLLAESGISMPLIGSANLIKPEHLLAMVDEGGADFAGKMKSGFRPIPAPRSCKVIFLAKAGPVPRRIQISAVTMNLKSFRRYGRKKLSWPAAVPAAWNTPSPPRRLAITSWFLKRPANLAARWIGPATIPTCRTWKCCATSPATTAG
jgi:hypothetical protein